MVDAGYWMLDYELPSSLFVNGCKPRKRGVGKEIPAA